MNYGQALRAVLNLPMARWLGIARRYDITAVELTSALAAGRDERVAVMDVVTILAANEARRAEQTARGESPRDVYAELEELSLSELMDVFEDDVEVDRDAEMAAAAEDEPAEGAGFPPVGAGEGSGTDDGGRVVAAAPGPDVSGPADQPGDVRPAVAG